MHVVMDISIFNHGIFTASYSRVSLNQLGDMMQKKAVQMVGYQTLGISSKQTKLCMHCTKDSYSHARLQQAWWL